MNYSIKKVISLSLFSVIIIVLFIYFWKWIDPALVDFKQQPVFLLDLKFLKDYLVLPGGIGDYLSLFISQFFHFSMVGALILVLIFFIVIILTRKLFSIFLTEDFIFILQFIPVFFLACLHSRYNYTLKPDIVIVTSLLLTLSYNHFINKGNLFKIALFILCSVLLVLLFGGVSLILFSILVILSEVRNKKKRYIQMAIGFFVISSVLPLIVGLYSPYMNIEKVFFDFFIPQKEYVPGVILYALFMFYPVVILCGVILSGITRFSILTGNLNRGRTLVAIIIHTTVPVIFLFLTLKYSYDRNDKALIELNYYAEKENWEAVFNAGKMLPPENRLVLFQLNRALYHSGRLTDDLFSINQLWGEDGLILSRYYNSKILMPISDYYFDIGYIKESLHWAYEALTKYEMAPIVMKRIALSNLILGEYKIAGKFLTILSKSIIQRKWAGKYLEYLNNEDLVRSDPLIQEKRELMPKHDYYAVNSQPEIDLYNLLKENPKNNMAFEYLMASSLLRHDIGNVIKNLHFLKEFNYTKIPRHIEEAILLYILFQQEENVELGPYKISKATTQRFNRYNYVLYNKHRNVLKNAQTELALHFRDTYWYYLHYVSPITTKKEIKERSRE